MYASLNSVWFLKAYAVHDINKSLSSGKCESWKNSYKIWMLNKNLENEILQLYFKVMNRLEFMVCLSAMVDWSASAVNV